MNPTFSKTLFLLLINFSTIGFAQSESGLGLPEFDRAARGGESKAVSKNSSVAQLTDGQGTRFQTVTKRGTLVALIEPEGEYHHPLKARPKSAHFVSFAMNASEGTIIEIGEVKLGIIKSLNVEGFASLMVRTGSGDWTPTHVHFPFKTYEGKRLASLPLLTVRLDPVTSEFDVYTDARLAIEGGAYEPEKGARRFNVSAGSTGAWLMGLVQSDSNPLYVDENLNGVDDDFELASDGQLSASNLSKEDRQTLIKAWQKTERFTPPPVIHTSLPTSNK